MGGSEEHGADRRGDGAIPRGRDGSNAVSEYCILTTSEFELWVPLLEACHMAWQSSKSQSGCKNKHDHQYSSSGMKLNLENAFKKHYIKMATCSYRPVEGPLYGR